MMKSRDLNFALLLLGILMVNSLDANPARFNRDPRPGLLSQIHNRHVLKMDQLIKPDNPFDSHIKHVPLSPEQEQNIKRVKKVVRKRVKVNRQKRDQEEDEIKSFRKGRSRGYSATHPKDFTDICGKQREVFTRFRPTFRILNGSCAHYGELPWVAQIQVRAPGGGYSYEQHCGGSIISDDLILTAAHCFQTFDHAFMRVVVGQHNLNSIDDEEQVFDIEDVIWHREWDSPNEGRYSNDIALVKIRRKGDKSGIRFSSNVAPACLPDKSYKFEDGMRCVIAGWGKTEAKGQVNTECLQAATVPIISNEECQEMYSRSNKRIARGMTCAGYRNGGVDTCRGDSGGPLACNVDGKFHLFGVVSWGEGCGAKNRPGVYSNVQYYLDWIDEMSRKLHK